MELAVEIQIIIIIITVLVPVPVVGWEVGVEGLPADGSDILLGTDLGQAQRVPSDTMATN